MATVGVVINDLLRSWFNLAGCRFLSRFRFAGNPLLLHDAPLSVRRAYTPRELNALAARAGMVPARPYRLPLHRRALAFRVG